MKLLFDQNLSPRLARLLADVYPESLHVHALGMDTASDSEIWERAKTEGFTIVSKDADFQQRSFALGHPPKVIWTRLGNCSVDQIADLLRERYIKIQYFHENRELSFLALR